MEGHDSQGHTGNSAQVAHSGKVVPSSAHEAVVARLCLERGARRKGFAAFMRQLGRALYDCGWDLKVVTFDHRGNPGEEIDPCVYHQVGKDSAKRPLVETRSWQLL